MKRCAKCGTPKPLDQFHRQSSGLMGRHSYCKDCANAYQKEKRKRTNDPISKRRWNLKSRYGLLLEDVEKMLRTQERTCAVCPTKLKKFCVDHDHKTGKIRGILCHRCNLAAGFMEDAKFVAQVRRYLERA